MKNLSKRIAKTAACLFPFALSVGGVSAAEVSPSTGENIKWIIIAAAVSIVLIVLLLILGGKRKK